MLYEVGVYFRTAAAFLDPRFKDLDPFVPETERKDVLESLKLEMLDLAIMVDGNT